MDPDTLNDEVVVAEQTEAPAEFDHEAVQDPLMPERHPQGDLFICDVADAVLKDIMAEMEHPFYSLSKKPDRNVRRYQNGDTWLEIIPSHRGIATIYDKDILIFCISQLVEKQKRGEPIANRIRITSNDLLRFCNRGTSGHDYKALSEALDRLAGTRIKTNIPTGDEQEENSFGLINSSTIRRKLGMDGRMLWVDVELSSWVMRAVRANEVLTLNRDYFRLRSPTERRIYELARKHCGRQRSFKMSLEVLLRKCGSQGSLKKLRFLVRALVAGDHLPDYQVLFDTESDKVTFVNRKPQGPQRLPASGADIPALPTTAYEAAKEAAPGYDVYDLEHQWREWWASTGKIKLDDPVAAFVGFCASKHKRAPLVRKKQ